MDCIIHGVPKSGTRLSNFHFQYRGGLGQILFWHLLDLVAKDMLVDWLGDSQLTRLYASPQKYLIWCRKQSSETGVSCLSCLLAVRLTPEWVFCPCSRELSMVLHASHLNGSCSGAYSTLAFHHESMALMWLCLLYSLDWPPAWLFLIKQKGKLLQWVKAHFLFVPCACSSISKTQVWLPWDEYCYIRLQLQRAHIHFAFTPSFIHSF